MAAHLVEMLYLLAAMAAIGACIPQLKQLIKAKASDEFSLGTWMTWAMTQTITLIYVISIGNMLMAAVNVVWVSFYMAMVLLIVRYRYKGRIDQANATVEIEV